MRKTQKNSILTHRFSKKNIMYKGYEYKGIKKSEKSDKKYKAIFKKNGRKREIHFGLKGMSDFTKHHDEERKKRYIKRHRKNENWKDLMSAGALSRWILWNKKTFKESK
jgi:hypothetical protein